MRQVVQPGASHVALLASTAKALGSIVRHKAFPIAVELKGVVFMRPYIVTRSHHPAGDPPREYAAGHSVKSVERCSISLAESQNTMLARGMLPEMLYNEFRSI
jgi:hypothetical protein